MQCSENDSVWHPQSVQIIMKHFVLNECKTIGGVSESLILECVTQALNWLLSEEEIWTLV